jgi:hypothetical protein
MDNSNWRKISIPLTQIVRSKYTEKKHYANLSYSIRHHEDYPTAQGRHFGVLFLNSRSPWRNFRDYIVFVISCCHTQGQKRQSNQVNQLAKAWKDPPLDCSLIQRSSKTLAHPHILFFTNSYTPNHMNMKLC